MLPCFLFLAVIQSVSNSLAIDPKVGAPGKPASSNDHSVIGVDRYAIDFGGGRLAVLRIEDVLNKCDACLIVRFLAGADVP